MSVNDGEDVLFLKAKSDGLRLLSFRPRSVEELRRRLSAKKTDAVIVERVIETFRKQGLLDDAKFAKLLSNAAILGRPVCRRKLEADLRSKGVAKEVIDKTLAGLSDFDEKKAAQEIVEKRFQKLASLPLQKKKARAFGYLKRRGFSNDAIYAALDTLDTEEI